MSADGDEDHGSFSKQRRNLILVSVLLIFSTFTTPTGTVSLLGVTLEGLTLQRVLIAAWLLGAYFMVRYWQYLRTETWTHYVTHCHTELNNALRHALPGLFTFLLPNDALPPSDIPGARLKVVLTSFAVHSNQTSGITVEAAFTRTFSSGNKSDSRATKSQLFVINGWRATRIRFAGTARALVLTPAGTQYLLPPLLFAAAIIVNIVAHWSSLRSVLA